MATAYKPFFSQDSHCIIGSYHICKFRHFRFSVHENCVVTELTNISPLSYTEQGTDFISSDQYFIPKRPIIYTTIKNQYLKNQGQCLCAIKTHI